MDMAQRVIQAQAVYRDGALQLLEPLDLPEGAEVQVDVRLPVNSSRDEAARVRHDYPIPSFPLEKLQNLIGAFPIGGDALADSEAIYDPDWP